MVKAMRCSPFQLMTICEQRRPRLSEKYFARSLRLSVSLTQIKLPLIVISVLRTLETGQFFSASFAISNDRPTSFHARAIVQA
jgi:hypothetical protein